MPYADPQKNKEANRRWYERNCETHKQRSKNRQKANREAHRAYMRKYRQIHGRSDRPHLSDAEKLHHYKPLQRWLENPKLSPNVAQLIKKAEQLFAEKQEKQKLRIIYNREKARRYKAKLRNVLIVQVSKKDLRRQFALFGDCCAYCGKQECEEILHIDHFHPISKGGTHVLTNLVPACKTCNYSKRNYHPEQWYKRQSFFSKQRWRFILQILKKSEKTIDQLSFL